MDNIVHTTLQNVTDFFEGKELVVYYISDDGNVEEYQVESKNGFAEFTTNHFSVYTLTAKKTTEEIPNNTSTKNQSNTEAKSQSKADTKTET